MISCQQEALLCVCVWFNDTTHRLWLDVWNLRLNGTQTVKYKTRISLKLPKVVGLE